MKNSHVLACVAGFIMAVSVLPFLILFILLGVCLGFEKDIESFFHPNKENE